MSHPFRSPERWWSLGGLVVLLGLAMLLCWRIDRPWINHPDFNGAVWAQAAHNNLRAGLATTHGLGTGFYFGPLPIPANGYYTHHPPGLPLLVTALFAGLGEHEWVARLVPVTASLATAGLLWWLVWSATGRTRAATLVVAVLATLPMFLHYGPMVNHESLALLAMLGALAGLRAWQQTGGHGGLAVLFASLGCGLLMAWHVYLFAGLLAGWLLVCGPAPARRLGGWILAVALGALALYFFHIRLGRPDAWSDLVAQFRFRLSLSSETKSVTWGQWLEQVSRALGYRIPLVAWLLAGLGVVRLIFWRSAPAGWRWLGALSLALGGLDLFYVIAFRNASYIHPYAAYYLVVPVAVLGGLELEVLGRVGERRTQLAGASGWAKWRWPVAIWAIVLMLAELGVPRALALNRTGSPILSWDASQPEPATLIPDLGRAIREAFPEGTEVLCNFLPVYAPHLSYYAQRPLLNNVTLPEHWRPILEKLGPRARGVIWMGEPGAAALVGSLPAGTRRIVTIDGCQFCFWEP